MPVIKVQIFSSGPAGLGLHGTAAVAAWNPRANVLQEE